MVKRKKAPHPLLIGWRCGACRKPVGRIEDGWVEWLVAGADNGVRGLRLVHAAARCRYDVHKAFRHGQAIVEGLPLARFVGPDGLILLLSMLASGDIPRDEILELVKRVQIPGYEQAREFFQDAKHQGVVLPAIADRYYLQSEIRTMLRWAEGLSTDEEHRIGV